MTKNEYGQRLLRLYNFKTVKQLAEHLGVEVTTLGGWLTQRVKTPPHILLRISTEKKVSIDYLMTGVETNPAIAEKDTIMVLVLRRGETVPVPVDDETVIEAARQTS